MATAIGIASGIAGLVTIAAQITKLTYTYISDVRNASRLQKEYLGEIAGLTAVLLRAEQSCKDTEDLGLLAGRPDSLSPDILEQCRVQLAKLQAELEKPKMKLLWPLQEREMSKSIQSLQRFRAVFTDFVSANTSLVGVATYRGVEILGMQQDKQCLQDWLHIPDEYIAKSPPAAYPGTGSWFLGRLEYCTWRDQEKPSILWCHGPPGAGKSVLASISTQDLLQKCQNPSPPLVLHHFCDYAMRQEDTGHILKSLLSQVVSVADREIILALRQQQAEIANNLRADHAAKVFGIICSTRSTFVIVDGVDEMDTLTPLLSLIQQLSAAGCRVLVMSRDVPDIRKVFGSHQQLYFSAHPTDLTTFICGRFRDSDFGERLASDAELTQVLVEKANGIFLLAKIFVNWLLSCTTIKKMRKSLSLLPNRLAEAFQSSVERIDKHSPEDRELAYRAIRWVANAERRLTMHGLLHGLAVEEDLEGEQIDEDNIASPNRLLKVAIGLLSWNEEDDTIRMVHTSAYEFFRERDREMAQEDLAKSCLLYLSADPMGSGSCEDNVSLVERLRRMPFLEYAAKSWGMHTHDAEAGISSLLDRFLSNERLRNSAWEALHYHAELTDSTVAALNRDSYPKNQTALHIAAFWNLCETTSRLLSDGADPSPPDSQNWTPLHWACERGHEEVVKILVKAGASLEARDSQGFTPVFWAAFRNAAGIVAILLESGANHLARDKNNWTATKYAISTRAQDAVMVLREFHTKWRQRFSHPVPLKTLSHDQALEFFGDSADKSLLEIAAEVGNHEVFHVLAEEKVRAGHFKDAWAVGYFDHPINNIWRVSRKIDYPLTANLRNLGLAGDSKTTLTSCTPQVEWMSRILHLAIKDNKLAAVQLLLDLGANANYNLLRPPLHVAAFQKDPSFVHVLLEHGADITSLAEYGMTPLHQAILNGFPETVAALISRGADVNARTAPRDLSRLGTESFTPPRGEMTPLMLAYGLDDPEAISQIARLLIDAKADLHAKDSAGCTIVHHAARSCVAADEFRYLSDIGVDLAAGDDKGWNLLHHLAGGGSNWSSTNVYALVKLLDRLGLKKSLDIELMPGTTKASTALSLALGTTTEQQRWSFLNWPVFEALHHLGFKLPSTFPELGDSMQLAIEDVRPTAMSVLAKFGGKPATSVPQRYVSFSREGVSSRPADFRSVIQHLQQDGWIIDMKDGRGETLIYSLTSSVDSQEMTQSLLDAGADIFEEMDEHKEIWLPNDKSNDIFVAAALNGFLENLRRLMAHAKQHPRPDHWSINLVDPVPSAREESDQDLLSRLLGALKAGGCMDRPEMDEASLLRKATKRKNQKFVSALLAHGASPHSVDSDGWQPLHWAAYFGDLGAIKELLAYGADVNASTRKWAEEIYPWQTAEPWAGTALHLAVFQGNIEIVAALLNAGANVNADALVSLTNDDKASRTPSHGSTALHIALDKRRFYDWGSNRNDIAMMLLEHGANVAGVADHLTMKQVVQLGRELWERIRVGITDQGQSVEMNTVRLW